MKSYEPFSMQINLKDHQAISAGELIHETVGGKTVYYKVLEIRSLKCYEAQVLVRELPGEKRNIHGHVILERCELCRTKLTKADQDRFGYECLSCVSDLNDTLRNISARVKIVTQPGNGQVIVYEDVQSAIKEMNNQGCVDVTTNVRDQMMVTFEAFGINVHDVDHFDWWDSKLNTYWHIMKPKEGAVV